MSDQTEISLSPSSSTALFVPSFYLEISGRRTGKTTRLCRAAIAHLEWGDAVIYTHNWRLGELIKMKVEPLVGIHKLVLCSFAEEETSIHLDNPRRFFDEWDWIQNCPFDPSGYYCSTLRRLRKPEDCDGDALFARLWRAANGRVYNCRNERVRQILGFERDRGMIEREVGIIFETNDKLCREAGQKDER